MELTPKMDRENIKKMAHSLLAYSRLRSLVKMSEKQLADMPKEVMIACAPAEIALVWEKLPEHMRNDIDMLKYQYCIENDFLEEQMSNSNSEKVICCFCNMGDIGIASDNSVSLEVAESTKRINIFSCCRGRKKHPMQ